MTAPAVVVNGRMEKKTEKPLRVYVSREQTLAKREPEEVRQGIPIVRIAQRLADVVLVEDVSQQPQQTGVLLT